ncbi:serine/threonine-protein phosphatase 4 regulatory subunit 1-like isoform X1 [Dermacentor silvarum]|uniref:serine/threonine-protein phosphatase 4 regulatory subunit 1-like isoform X1 n=1 Tax=Dermacentor silvarum TaxID=543639 RepID=UPI00189B3A9D|nr:serine/threonine-protein phosphatase 4 regulatory subunit 1-like isoform X1 [Dermacentor silvarum]
MPDDGDGLVPNQRPPLGEADSLNTENEELSRWSHFSLAMLAAEQEAASAEQRGEDCEDDDDSSARRHELEEPDPVTKLERYAYSDIVFNRQLVARNIVDTLRVCLDSQDAVSAVLSALSSISMDCEPSVRTELVEQLPNIASFCASEGGLLENVVKEHVVSILVQYLTDVANQVRKRTQVSLLFILERGLIDRKQLEEQICSLVVHLTESENMDDYRMEAVTLMTKMAPYIGKETTAALFLPRFVSLCQDSSFHIRKVCAANFGDFCSIVGQECTEDNLNVFQMLCEDCVWGVRKACAEVFMPVSCVCSLATRRNSLAPLFLSLLDDQSRWVRIAAFQALGPFISTFADPLRTGLYCSEDGVVSVRTPDGPADAFIELEAPSPAGIPALPAPLEKPGLGEDTHTSDLPLASTVVLPATDLVNCSEVAAVDEDEGASAVLDKGEQQAVCEDDKGEPCRANSCMATAEGTCGHKSSSLIVVLPDQPEDVAAGCSAEAVADSTSTAQGSSEGNEPQKDVAQGLLEGNEPQKNVSGEPKERTQNFGIKEPLSVQGDRHRLVLHVDSGPESNFNTFQFWRVPIPEVEVDIEFLGDRATAVHVRAKSQDQDNRCFSSDLSVEVLGVNTQQSATTAVSSGQDSTVPNERLSGDSSTLRIRTASLSSLTSADQECNLLLSSSVTEASVSFNEAGEVAGVHKIRMSKLKEVAGSENTLLSKSFKFASDSWSAQDQDIVPVLLLERYQTMTDPALAQNLDSEIGRHCAHSLPAVALTLGRHYWPCLRMTYRCLVSDVQWKVRHIVASCLHELATILGPQIASRDLVPSFEGFVRDVDEVRVGLLERLAPFLRGLSRGDQRRSLPLLADFLCMDNHRNWRFRFTLARQLKEIAALYCPLDIHQYLVPIVNDLLVDKVAEVRHMSIEAVVMFLQRLEPHYLMCKQLLQEMCVKVHDRKWSQRQLFCELAEQMVNEECLSEDEFIGTVLPKLLYLRNDTVPNVRMALARCLVRSIWPKAYFWDTGNFYREELKATLGSLQEDLDRDVRFCAQTYPKDSVD